MYKNEQHYKMLPSKVIDLLRKKTPPLWGFYSESAVFTKCWFVVSETNETNKKKKTDLDKEGSVFRFIVKTGT